jgi:hypothetical protein
MGEQDKGPWLPFGMLLQQIIAASSLWVSLAVLLKASSFVSNYKPYVLIAAAAITLPVLKNLFQIAFPHIYRRSLALYSWVPHPLPVARTLPSDIVAENYLSKLRRSWLMPAIGIFAFGIIAIAMHDVMGAIRRKAWGRRSKQLKL